MEGADATALALLFNPNSAGPVDPATGKLLTRAAERIDLLVRNIEKTKGTLVVPTPALAEILVKAEDQAPEILDRLNRSACFKVSDFDQRAAVELAAMTREAVRKGDKFGGSVEPWQKVKMDRQIIAIARVNNVQTLYSDDGGLYNFAVDAGIRVVRTWELPLPDAQPKDLFSDLGTPSRDPETSS